MIYWLGTPLPALAASILISWSGKGEVGSQAYGGIIQRIDYQGRVLCQSSCERGQQIFDASKKERGERCRLALECALGANWRTFCMLEVLYD